MNFREKLDAIVHDNNSLLCIGLDSDTEKIPSFLFETSKTPILDFNRAIINATKDIVCAYKLNLAFYEVLGKSGIELLEKTLRFIPRKICTILDGKRNDIGNTARKYAEAFFKFLKADATTVNPYLGKDSIYPFLEYKNRCSFILCRTSNPSAVDFQDLNFSNDPLYIFVAKKIKEWNVYDNCGAVVGATYPYELQRIRKILGDNIPILIPGVGKQGGDVEKTVKTGINKYRKMALINSSRGIIFASTAENFANDAREKAILLRNEINKYRI